MNRPRVAEWTKCLTTRMLEKTASLMYQHLLFNLFYQQTSWSSRCMHSKKDRVGIGRYLQNDQLTVCLKTPINNGSKNLVPKKIPQNGNTRQKYVPLVKYSSNRKQSSTAQTDCAFPKGIYRYISFFINNKLVKVQLMWRCLSDVKAASQFRPSFFLSTRNQTIISASFSFFEVNIFNIL